MKREGLLRILGLVIALGLVSLSAVEAWPAPYDNCHYTCSGGGYYVGYTTYSDCCSGNPSALWCPPGETPYPGTSWGGGYDHMETFCWW